MQDLEDEVFSSIEEMSIRHVKCENMPRFKGSEELSKDGKDAPKHESDKG